MNDIKVIHANKSHKDFLIYANKVINNTNETEQTNGLKLKYYSGHEINFKFYYKKRKWMNNESIIYNDK